MSSQSDAPSARQPRLKRGEARVAGLLAAGAAVFAERGYDAATMTEIAARAQAAIGSLYQFFPTKQLLAEALHAQMSAGLSELMESLAQNAPQRSAAAIVDEMFVRLTVFLTEHPAFLTLTDRRDVDKAHKAASRVRIRGQIARLLETSANQVPPDQARAMAALVLELMKSVVLFTSEDDPAVHDGSVALLREMFRRQLSP